MVDKKSNKDILNNLSNIVHDIKTPTNSLLGFLTILEEKIEDDRLKNYIEHAKHSAELIVDLTQSILDNQSIKKVKNSIQTVNSVQYFSEIAEIFSANMAKKHIDYIIFIDPNIPQQIELDSMKIKRVLINLIGNAYKFTPKYGRVEVKILLKKDRLKISVKDTGIGISKNKQKKIFKAYTQAKKSIQEIYGGNGLGLSISSKYLKQMNSKLKIKSKENSGSEFYFSLKISTLQNSKKKTQPSKNSIAILTDKPDSKIVKTVIKYLKLINQKNISVITDIDKSLKEYSHLIVFENRVDKIKNIKNIKTFVIEENFLKLNKKEINSDFLVSKYYYFGEELKEFIKDKITHKILIIEDNQTNAILLKTMLEDKNCHIDIAKDGKEGLDMLTFAFYKNIPYKVVYIDHNLPKLNGDNVIKEYKKITKDSNISTICISGSHKIKNKKLYDFIIPKPFNKEQILESFCKSI